MKNLWRCTRDWSYSEVCVKGVVLEAEREVFRNGEHHLLFNIDGRIVSAPSIFFTEVV